MKIAFRIALCVGISMLVWCLGVERVLAQAPADPQLQVINVVFGLPPYCDDRDYDTKTDIKVIFGGQTVAENADVASGVHLDDRASTNGIFGTAIPYGPYSIPVSQLITKSQFLQSATVVHIQPVGNDTWCTTISIDALFSDGTHLQAATCNVVKISEVNRDTQFANGPVCAGVAAQAFKAAKLNDKYGRPPPGHQLRNPQPDTLHPPDK